MPVNNAKVDLFVKGALERLDAAKEKKKRTKNKDILFSTEDFFRLIRAQSKFTGLESDGQNNNFDMQNQLIQLQQYQMAQRNYEISKRREAYGLIGKEVIVKNLKNSNVGEGKEAIRGTIDFVEFPKGTQEPTIYVNGEQYSLEDIIGVGNVEKVVENSENKIFDEEIDVAKTNFELVQEAFNKIKQSVQVKEKAKNNAEAQKIMEVIDAKIEEIKSYQKGINKEIDRLKKVEENKREKLEKFEEAGNVENGKGITKEDLIEQIKAVQKTIKRAEEWKKGSGKTLSKAVRIKQRLTDNNDDDDLGLGDLFA